MVKLETLSRIVRGPLHYGLFEPTHYVHFIKVERRTTGSAPKQRITRSDKDRLCSAMTTSSSALTGSSSEAAMCSPPRGTLPPLEGAAAEASPRKTSSGMVLRSSPRKSAKRAALSPFPSMRSPRKPVCTFSPSKMARIEDVRMKSPVPKHNPKEREMGMFNEEPNSPLRKPPNSGVRSSPRKAVSLKAAQERSRPEEPVIVSDSSPEKTPKSIKRASIQKTISKKKSPPKVTPKNQPSLKERQELSKASDSTKGTPPESSFSDKEPSQTC